MTDAIIEGTGLNKSEDRGALLAQHQRRLVPSFER